MRDSAADTRGRDGELETQETAETTPQPLTDHGGAQRGKYGVWRAHAGHWSRFS